MTTRRSFFGSIVGGVASLAAFKIKAAKAAAAMLFPSPGGAATASLAPAEWPTEWFADQIWINEHGDRRLSAYRLWLKNGVPQYAIVRAIDLSDSDPELDFESIAKNVDKIVSRNYDSLSGVVCVYKVPCFRSGGDIPPHKPDVLLIDTDKAGIGSDGWVYIKRIRGKKVSTYNAHGD